MISGLRAPKMLTERLRPPEPRSAACLNCAQPLSGPYCAQCGQRDVPPYPTVRELAFDAFWELSGWDGRFAATLRGLVTKPGWLTLEFLEGRRVRYISPLRLYLVASLVYFLVAATAPERTVATEVTLSGVHIGVTETTPQKVGKAMVDARTRPLTQAERDSALAGAAKAPRLLRPLIVRAVGDPQGFKRSMIETMPRALFVLVPVFAAIVALFYRGRRYPEHLYFSLHLHAFVFAALAVGALGRFTRVPAIASVTGTLAFWWAIGYAVLAFRRVYKESLGRTLAKFVGIGAIYAVAGMVVLTGAVFWTAYFG